MSADVAANLGGARELQFCCTPVRAVGRHRSDGQFVLAVRQREVETERAVRADASRWLWRQAQGEYGDDRSMPWQAIRDTLSKYSKGGVGVGLAVG